MPNIPYVGKNLFGLLSKSLFNYLLPTTDQYSGLGPSFILIEITFTDEIAQA
jgi:hypothetical protein